jgi:ketosteroid isomerase-like protein
LEPSQQEKSKKEVTNTIYAFFEAGKNKDLTSLAKFHSPSASFTKFDESPPYTRQTAEEAFIYEQAAFANLSDYQYEIHDLRIDPIGEVAVATFYLTYSGVFVNDYSFEGKTVKTKSRVTMIFAKFHDSWKIIHEHFSSVPDWKETAEKS